MSQQEINEKIVDILDNITRSKVETDNLMQELRALISSSKIESQSCKNVNTNENNQALYESLILNEIQRIPILHCMTQGFSRTKDKFYYDDVVTPAQPLKESPVNSPLMGFYCKKFFAFSDNGRYNKNELIKSSVQNLESEINSKIVQYLKKLRMDSETKVSYTSATQGSLDLYWRLRELRSDIFYAIDNLGLNPDEQLQAPFLLVDEWVAQALKDLNEFVPAAIIRDIYFRKGAIGRIASFDVIVIKELEELAHGLSHEVYAGINPALSFIGDLSTLEVLTQSDDNTNLIRGLYIYGYHSYFPQLLASAEIVL